MGSSYPYLAVLACLCASAEPLGDVDARPNSANEIILEAMKAARAQKQRLPPYSVSRSYTIRNAHLNSPAVLQVLWTYKPGAGKQFKVLDSKGLSGLTRRALMKVIQTEANNSRLDADPASITPEHYSFELAALEQNDYKLRLIPHHKSEYLVNGYAVVIRNEGTIIRVEGTTSKRLSFWVGEANVIQEFANYSGFWLPSKTQSTAHVRFAGKTELTIQAGEYQFAGSR